MTFKDNDPVGGRFHENVSLGNFLDLSEAEIVEHGLSNAQGVYGPPGAAQNLTGVSGLGPSHVATGGGTNGGGGPKIVRWRGDGLKIRITAIKGVTGERVKKLLPFRFQCPPLEQVEFVMGYNHVQYDTVDSGQMSRRGGRLLTTVQFDTLVVEGWHRFVVAPGMWDYKDTNRALKRITDEGRPVMLQMAHRWPATEFEMPCTLGDLHVVEKAGEPDGRYYTVAFTEWRDAEITRKGKGGSSWPKHITLDKDDTLSNLATKYWGKPSQARYLGSVNHLAGWGVQTPIVDSKKYKPGDRFTIPEPPRMGLGKGQALRENG